MVYVVTLEILGDCFVIKVFLNEISAMTWINSEVVKSKGSMCKLDYSIQAIELDNS